MYIQIKIVVIGKMNSEELIVNSTKFAIKNELKIIHHSLLTIN